MTNPKYWIEAWALGMFMVSAVVFTWLIETPGMPLHDHIPSAGIRRWLGGCAMGLTAVGLIYSGWGRRSGALMNPALTLAFWSLGKIGGKDALAYSAAQILGAAAAMGLMKLLMPEMLMQPEVDYVTTTPNIGGPAGAFMAEVLMSFGMLLTVLYSSNEKRTAPYTGVFAGILIMAYITLCGPISGMSLNPARSLASALAASKFDALWIYFTAPPLGMYGAAICWKTWICQKPEFRCSFR